MSHIKAYPSPALRPADFIKFRDDLELLLTVCAAGELAKWMGKDKGNFSKKLNGVEPITSRFLGDFYRKLGPAIGRARQGAAGYELAEEMTEHSPEESAALIKYQVRVTDLAAGVDGMREEILELKNGAGEMRVELREVETVLKQHGSALAAHKSILTGQAATLAEQETTLSEQNAAIRRLEEAVFGPLKPEI